MLSAFLRISICCLLLISCGIGNGQENPNVANLQLTKQIRVNQIGYYPKAVKKAVVVVSRPQERFYLVDSLAQKIVFTAELSPSKQWPLSGEKVQIANFTGFSEEGTYTLVVPGLGHSYPFKIQGNVLREVFHGSVKGLYYQRAGMSLAKEYAGKWHRPMGHPDDSVLFHPSTGKGEGRSVSSGGWYDAGDYNKYIVNACFPLGHYFLLQEQYPNILPDNTLSIPESGNGTSDFLDELKYEMDWALTMQDTDGGLFHKLTTKRFEGMVMPDKALNQRYIVGKGTAATLDFAASAAQAYRVFLKVNPSYAEKCLNAAKRAYEWADTHPSVPFVNPEDIHTGQYGDDDFNAEKFWAAAELYLATQNNGYLNDLKSQAFDTTFKPGESWTAYMRFLGMFSMLEHKKRLPISLVAKLEKGIIASADTLVQHAYTLDYLQPINDFHWGSNSDVLNAAMIMAQAYRIVPKPKYLSATQQCMDYILGNNALGVSFVTGFGESTPMHIHHRQSAADGIPEPVPGLLSGGPNSRLQDVSNGVVYPKGAPPMKCWVDQEASYASNEICLNWNAPLTYVLGFLEEESK